ncbi:MAG TPA: hypothetical protein VKB18_07360 [Gemmatimonadota bacterium]|nr:hypothetical protein [Gemmatimonadota bacterium]
MRRILLPLLLAVLGGVACAGGGGEEGAPEIGSADTGAGAAEATAPAPDTAPSEPGPALGTPEERQCTTCHLNLSDSALVEPAVAFVQSIHGTEGLACAGCHGGDAAATDAALAHRGMLARPPRTRIPELCARCHANATFMKRFDPNLRIDQLARYRTSVHGRRLLQEGDTRVATCVSCHSSHAIKPPSEEMSTVHPKHIPELCGSCHSDADRMAPYGIPTDQEEEYRQSVHWEAVSEKSDLSAPVCNDCHGNHGAVPPGFASVGFVCADCHAQIGTFFSASVHDTAFLTLKLPACATCHGNHRITHASDTFLALGEGGVCGGSGCHTPADPGGRAALTMRSLIDSLRTRFEQADSILLAAEQAGMPVSQAQFELRQGRNALVQAHAATHSALVDSVRARVGEGLAIADSGVGRGRAAFAELKVRREGLAASTGGILVLIIGLLLKIRQVERDR